MSRSSQGSRNQGSRSQRSGRQGSGRRGTANAADDRPYLIALVGLLVVVAAMAIGPLRSLAAANDRVDRLTEERDVLAEEVDELSERRDALHDPEELRIEARQELGLVMPGDDAYVVLPEPDAPPAAGEDNSATGNTDGSSGDDPWYRRLLDAVGRALGG